MIFPQPGRPAAGARAEEVALAAASPAPLPPAPRPSERQRSPCDPGSRLPTFIHLRRPRCIRAPHAPLSLSCTPSPPHAKLHAPLHDSARPSRCPRPAPLRLAPLRPSFLGTLPLSAGPPTSSSRPPQPLNPRPPLPPPRFPHFPRPLFALVSPPFASQPWLRSWGRAYGFSCSGEGLNRAEID